MDYLKALEEERKKILVFERELPLSLQLVTQAIENCKKKNDEVVGRGEEIASEGPILEEFIPLRPSCSSSDEENNHKNSGNSGGSDKKPDWMRSVQLWNQQPEPKGDVVMKPIAVNAKRIGGAFHPFEKEKVAVKTPVVAAAPASSTTENTSGGNGGSGGSGGSGSGEEREREKEKEGTSQRKARRCWSPELHRRFLNALQQLGGSHVATPKQIRELMKVDGLTNDEVKSHLQKYRLHTRRPTASAVQNNTNSSPQQPQIVLVGGIWMPPPQYNATQNAPLNTVFAPVASHPSQQQKHQSKQKNNRSPTSPLNSKERCEGDDNSEDAEQTNSDSSATSSSSQTTTASAPLVRVC